jgi:hypothetical protein
MRAWETTFQTTAWISADYNIAGTGSKSFHQPAAVVKDAFANSVSHSFAFYESLIAIVVNCAEIVIH